MKKILFIFLLLLYYSSALLSQVNLTGDAKYKLLFNGYYGQDPDACGDIHGFRHLKARYADGQETFLYNDRAINQNLDFEVEYTKHNRIVNLNTYIIIRWKTGIGCNGGPSHRYNDYPINECNYSYLADPGNEFHELSILSYPHVRINTPDKPMYLSDDEYLTITLPDNIDNKYYKWKYKVGNEEEKYFPDTYNNKPVLQIRGDEFLKEVDFGKTISVWIETNCSFEDQYAFGIARRESYLPIYNDFVNCLNTWGSCLNACGILNFDCRDDCSSAFQKCQSDIIEKKNKLTEQIYNSIKSNYTFKNSNVITFSYNRSSPKIVNPSKVKNASCYDEEDGKAAIEFDRQLKDHETLELILTKKNVIQGTYEPYSTISLPTVTDSYLFENLEQGEYRLQLIGKYKGIPTYTDGENHTSYFTINRPEPVKFSTITSNVKCFGGSDGTITISASGGEGGYAYQIESSKTTTQWTQFDNANNTIIHGFLPGQYKIKVKDKNNCLAKQIQYDGDGNILGLGNEVTEVVNISQPEKALNIKYVDYKEPTAFGFTDGYIRAQITGGTPLKSTKLYTYKWLYEDGKEWTQIDENIFEGNEGWFLTLKQAKAGKYRLTIKDANYNATQDNAGCTIIESEYVLSQPKALSVSLDESQCISCNTDNKYGDETDKNPIDGQRDESQNGILSAKVTGGVKPYQYTWKKEVNNVWTKINTVKSDANTSTAYHLSDGNYAFNVKDANGIILGEYKNNILQKTTDKITYLHEPVEFKLEADIVKPTCSVGNNGMITIIPKGGVAPFEYSWSTGAKTSKLTNLVTGIYKVIVTDTNGCRAEKSITLDAPKDIEIKYNKSNITCYGGNNGSISIFVDGGTKPYKYKWNTGHTGTSISNLSAGMYSLTITDAGGCKAIKDIEIQNPEEIKIDLGKDRTLCLGQKIDLNAEIDIYNAKYSWSSNNGFESDKPHISIEKAGLYRIKATTPLGCIVTDEISISYSDSKIGSEFLLATQAYADEDVVLVNVSEPLGEKTYWDVPNNVEILHEGDREITLRFSEKGTYKIGLTSTQGDCYEYYEKNIIVEPIRTTSKAENANFIKEFTVFPNPNDGNFKIKVDLIEESSISLRIFNLNGLSIGNEKKFSGNKEYLIDYNLTDLGTSTYIIVLETKSGTKVLRMVTY